MAQRLQGTRVAFVVANEGVEQAELECPWQAVLDAGGEPELIAPSLGSVQAMNHLDKAETFEATRTAADADPDDYAAVVLPGGVANPDQLRMDPDAVAFVRALFQRGRPAAVICHGPWTLVEADLVRGRRLTSWPSLQTDIRNAGGEWVDEEVVVCTGGPNTLITSRKPDDLPAFCAKLLEALSTAPTGAAAR
jgi:protease I